MLQALTKNKFTFLTFLVSLAVLFFFYHDVLLAPNDFIFAPDGDGIKNYYTFLYHAQYDTSFSHFSGMNYPYYEHIVYTDATPLLSYLIGKLGLANYGIGILNLCMLLSYPIAAVFLFKILRHYQVNNVWALLGAVAITFLSPQVFRLTGHLSLSYVFAIPLMWWLLIKCYTGRKWLWSGIIGLYLLLFFLIHPYLGLIMAFFSIVFWLVNAVANRKRIWQSLTHIGIQTLAPIILFQAYISLTDTHVNRLSNPGGFFHYYASWKSILIAHDGPLSGIYSAFKINIGNWESWSYIGFSTLVFAVMIAFYLAKRRKKIAFKSFLKKELVLFVITAYLILLFAFCFPLKYDWLKWIADSFGPLKQFRVLGRFTWVFFYVFTIATVVGMYKMYQNQRKPVYPIIFFCGIFFYALEFTPPHKNISIHISAVENKFKPENVDAPMRQVIDFANTGDYDAIIFLPFQHMSSENIMMLGAEKANLQAFLISYHTHLPLMNSISSRMSLTEAIKFNNYFSPGFMEKELTYDLPENDRILLVKNKEPLEPYEFRMIWRSEQVFANAEYDLFDFDPRAWNDRTAFDKIITQEKQATVDLGEGWRSDTSNVWFYYASFDSITHSIDDPSGNALTTNEILGGTGAFKDIKKGWNTILELDKTEIEPGNYVMRYWYHILADTPDGLAILEEQYSEDSVLWVSEFDIKQATIIVGNWCLVEMEFTLSPEMQDFKVFITGNSSQKPFIVDELLIQKQNDSPLFRKASKDGVNYVIYNNYWLREDSFER